MQVIYGSYLFPANACYVGMRQYAILNEAEIPYIEVREIDISGRLYDSGQAALSADEALLIQACSVSGVDLIFKRDDGGIAAACSMLHNNTLDGVKCIRGPDFTSRYGAEYVSQREFQITFQGKFPILNTSTALIQFDEEMTYGGGYPEFIEKPAINGPAQIQLSAFQRAYTLIQSGSATGFMFRPKEPPPAFPLNLRTAPVIRKSTPKRIGNTYYQYKISWTYEMMDVNPLIAFPTLWT